MKKMVILLHGIGRTPRSMRHLEKALVNLEYQVMNIGYDSRKKSISSLASDIYQHIQPFCNNKDYVLNFVTHSMGGLVTRQLLAHFNIHNVGRVVMLAPPNQGSEIADFLNNNFLYKLIYGPAGQELTTHTAKTKPFPNVSAQVGIIAGNRCIDPISYFILPSKHDGKVTIENTKLKGMSDHIVICASHSFIMHNKNVIYQVIYFLNQGKFEH